MIIEKLDDLYRRLSSRPGSSIPVCGYSVQKVSFEVVLGEGGSLAGIHDLRTGSGSSKKARAMNLPGQTRPTGPGINPRLFWDNATYMLGYGDDQDNSRRVAAAFACFKTSHLGMEEMIDDPRFSMVCRFLEQWDPTRRAAAHARVLDDVSKSGFGVFRIEGMDEFLHELPFVDRWIREWQTPQEGPEGQCLVTGERGSVATLHEPAIKGVRGAQPCGAKLVSFNCRSFCSYGKERGLNAPMSHDTVFRYATALNELIADSKRKTLLGDATIVFWTREPSIFEEALLDFFSHGVPVLPVSGDHAGTPVSILALSPNTARLSVRFWHHGTVGTVSRHLARYGSEIGPYAPRMLFEQACKDGNAVAPIMTGALLRSLFEEAPYPVMLVAQILSRIREQHRFDDARLALLRGFLTRNLGKASAGGLDEHNHEPAYLLGRLHAVHDKTHSDAGMTGSEAGKARFYGAVSSRPGVFFPAACDRFRVDLKRLPAGLRRMRELECDAIRLPRESIPMQLDLEGQALFALGFCHQRAYFFTTRKHPTIAAQINEPQI